MNLFMGGVPCSLNLRRPKNALKKIVNLVSRVFSYSAPELEKNLRTRLACVASVANRVIARKLERKRKTKRCPLFFALVPTFSTNSRGNACYAG